MDIFLWSKWAVWYTFCWAIGIVRFRERDITTSIQGHRSVETQTPHVPVLLVFRVCMRAQV
jgi:hypothetical protein